MQIKTLLLLDDAKMSKKHVAQRKTIKVANKCTFRVVNIGNQKRVLPGHFHVDYFLLTWISKMQSHLLLSLFPIFFIDFT